MKDSSRMAAQAAGYARVIGLDLSDRKGTFVELDADPAKEGILSHGTVTLSEAALRTRFGAMPPYRMAIEVGTHSPWVSRLLAELGHQVILANPRQVPLISRSGRKTDRVDAECLARLARVDPELLRPTHHRGAQTQADLAIIRSRDALVRNRTALVNTVRGQVKAFGGRLRASSTAGFASMAPEALPAELRPALLPLLETIAHLTAQIKRYDRTIVELAKTRYPDTALLQRVEGVGALTALTFVLTIEDPARFPYSRAVGAYLGLTRRRDQSGQQDPNLPITKAGDEHLRWLLTQCAHYILGPFGHDSDLRRWGLRLAGEGASQHKKRAITAVARKLAVLLHHLWATAEIYDPLYQATQRERIAASRARAR
jgi:transposase